MPSAYYSTPKNSQPSKSFTSSSTSSSTNPSSSSKDPSQSTTHHHQQQQQSSTSSSSSSASKNVIITTMINDLKPRIWRFHPDHIASSPSILDGLTSAQEYRIRRASCNHIIETIRLVMEEHYRQISSQQTQQMTTSPSSLSSNINNANKYTNTSYCEQKMRGPASTAMVLFNRFYMRQSFYRHHRWHVATACAFMGLKVEENITKIRTVINSSWEAYHGNRKPKLEQFGSEFPVIRQHILDTERCVLYTLEFDVAVEHPYPIIKNTVIQWKDQGVFGTLFPRNKPLKDAPYEITTAMITANNIAFTCLGSDLCLRYSPQEIAITSLFIGLESTYTLRNLDCPIGIEQYRKLIDIDTLMEISNLFYKYLQDDAEQDTDFRKVEEKLQQQQQQSSSSSSLSHPTLAYTPLSIASSINSMDTASDNLYGSTSSFTSNKFQNIQEQSYDLGIDSIMMPQLTATTVVNSGTSSTSTNNNTNSNGTILTHNTTTLTEFKNMLQTKGYSLPASSNTNSVNHSATVSEQASVRGSNDEEGEEGEEGEDQLHLPTLS